MNYISFSLWGENPKYCLGAIHNIEVARSLYPGWGCVFWVDNTVPKEILLEIRSAGGEARFGIFLWGNRMFDRFMIADDPNCDRYIIRDADSRITEREVAAVNAWVNSGLMSHSMRDHWAHAREINGGLWGAVRGAIPSMRQLIDDYKPDDEYGEDQTFLCRMVWPMVKHSCLQHDSVSRHLFPGSIPFPTKRNGSKRFVGEVFDIGQNGEEIPRDFDCAAIDEWKD